MTYFSVFVYGYNFSAEYVETINFLKLSWLSPITNLSSRSICSSSETLIAFTMSHYYYLTYIVVCRLIVALLKLTCKKQYNKYYEYFNIITSLTVSFTSYLIFIEHINNLTVLLSIITISASIKLWHKIVDISYKYFLIQQIYFKITCIYNFLYTKAH